MPRNVRNFWAEVRVDGRASACATGPQRADGGLEICLLNRDNGSIASDALRVVCRALSSGELVVTVLDGDREVYRKVATR